jgi:hypothetical protein
VRVLLRATTTATRDLHLKVISERLVILTSECRAVGEGYRNDNTFYFKRFRFDAAGVEARNDSHRSPGR